MKTEVGHYYVFVDAKDFWKKVYYWHKKGYRWVFEKHEMRKKKLNRILKIK